MKKFKYGLTLPRLLFFVVLIATGAWHFWTYGWEESKPEEIWLGLVLLVALLGSIILRFYLTWRRGSKTR